VVLASRLTSVHAISGPTHSAQFGVKPFKWSEAGFEGQVSHEGMPDAFEFDWVIFGDDRSLEVDDGPERNFGLRVRVPEEDRIVIQYRRGLFEPPLKAL
jgi:hypothetical protein